MNYEKLLEMIYLKSPNILFGIGIFVLFWVFSKIVQMMINNLLSSKNEFLLLNICLIVEK